MWVSKAEWKAHRNRLDRLEKSVFSLQEENKIRIGDITISNHWYGNDARPFETVNSALRKVLIHLGLKLVHHAELPAYSELKKEEK